MNAIILAAGMASRFVPLSEERPKGLLEVRGEILIERQIRQLKEAGISDITIVVGFKAEQFRNVSVYPLVCKLLKIKPSPNDGDLEEVKAMLR